MKILVLSDRFYPEVAAPSFRTLEHARVWISEGHEVTVVTCAPNFPKGRVFEGYRNGLYQVEDMEGITVIRVWSYMAENKGFLKRILDYVSFMISAVIQCWRYPKSDVILATSPPLMVAMAGYAIGKLRRRPWVFELRDLWPASIRAVGASNSILLSFLEKLEIFLYRRADRIISLTRSFRDDLIKRGIDREKIDVVENGVDLELFDPSAVTLDARKILGIKDDCFLAGYVGTVGMAHGLETLLEAANLCKEDPRIHFLIMGEGAERGKLEELAEKMGLDNVTFADFVPHEQIPAFLAAMDVVIVHLKAHPLFRTVIPSKIFEAMAMGKPLIHAVEGESARIVEESGAGICVPSGNAEALAEAVVSLRESPEMALEFKKNGRRSAEQRYGRRVKADAAIGSLQRLVVQAGTDGFSCNTSKASHDSNIGVAKNH